MKKLRAWFATPGGRQFFNIIYSLGAAVVIIGALFKIIHIRGGDTIFIIGMSIEAFIFFLSAFDTSYTDSSPATGAGGGYVINTNDAIQTHPTVSSGSSSTEKAAQSTGGGSSVIVVGGGSSGGTAVTGGTSAESGSVAPSTGGSNIQISGGSTSSGVSGGGYSGSSSVVGSSSVSGSNNVGASNVTTGLTGGSVNIPADEYAQSAASATQNLEDFSQTMKSLNETSQTILQAYKEIAETQNLGETMNTLRYINDSLARIKNLYDGAIGDSYMFKEEMSKMTRHIEALNQVYARLLQAMTMNNPNNNNNFPQNPPY